MKRLLFFVLFSIITFTAFSQMSPNYDYSIAVRGFTIMQMPKILNEFNFDKFTNATLNGVMVKFNDNQISYRLNGTYYSKSKSFYNNCETCEEANGKLVDYSFKLGFEKNFNYYRFQPYFGLDAGYRSNKFDGQISNIHSALSNKVEASKVGLIISPLIGFKINPIDQLSIFAEGSLDFFYSYERQVTINDSNAQMLNKYYKAEFLPNPISVGIQVHLGSNK